MIRDERSFHKHIIIENVQPSVDGGLFAAKRVVGDSCLVTANVFGDGPDTLRVSAIWQGDNGNVLGEATLSPSGNDEWVGQFPLECIGRYKFRIESWSDALATWQGWIKRKAQAAEDIRADLLEGAELAAKLARHAVGADVRALEEWAAYLRSSASSDPGAAALRALEPGTTQLFSRVDQRISPAVSPDFELVVDPRLASFAAWYEMFPRSQGNDPERGATLREAEARLPAIRDMGFDVLYLPPIHPIGTTNRKGRNNSLTAGPNDPGSPWQIGGASGGHTALEPALGKLEDFDHFLATARRLGLEVALDFAIQCSPDHPWVKEHPEWFSHRPDGSIKYAENPPKKYQDIYPINFDTSDEKGLWEALKQVVLFWIARGVRVFRVDNPHTKPVRFWAWLITEVKRAHPEIVFLAEAFTRPKMMKMLAKVGFSQSYTYFTWRDSKQDLTEYLTELSSPDVYNVFRPNFFVNTPDILPPILQHGGPPAFRLRLVLAATLSPTYGIYSGYELCENAALPGTEEYADSEKYQIKVRDYDQPGHIKELVTRLNTARRDNAALQQLSNVEFLNIDNPNLLAYAKATPNGDNVLLIVVNLDPRQGQQGTVQVPPEVVGREPGSTYEVHDLLSDQRFTWSAENYVYLDPAQQPAHVLLVEAVR